MRVAYTKPLFAWDRLEDSPSLQTIKAFLTTLSGGQLLDGRRRARGRGRNEYPVPVLWGTVLLTVILRHPNWEACLADLRRNEALRRLIGIRSEKAVPKKWNLSYFLEVLEVLGKEPHLTRVRAIFDVLIQRLGMVVEDLGKATASDAATLSQTLEQAQANLLEGRIETLAFDKAADDHQAHKLLNRSGIKPLIEMRSLWKEEPLRMLPGHDGNWSIVYDEKGTLFCYDRTSQPMVLHQMADNG